MKILSLDLGTKTGWCCVKTYQEMCQYHGKIISSGVNDFSLKRGDSPGMRFIYFKRWLMDVINEWNPDVIVYEQAHHRGGAATAVGVGLQSWLLGICADGDIEHTAVHTGTLKKHATGKGNASKEEMKGAAKAVWTGVDFIDDNHVDAYWLADWAMDNLLGEAA
jgi:Holliday junction resolvasome RuvABC endonuclease subunit